MPDKRSIPQNGPHLLAALVNILSPGRWPMEDEATGAAIRRQRSESTSCATRATTGDHLERHGLRVDHRLDRVSSPAPESQKTRETCHVPGCLASRARSMLPPTSFRPPAPNRPLEARRSHPVFSVSSPRDSAQSPEGFPRRGVARSRLLYPICASESIRTSGSPADRPALPVAPHQSCMANRLLFEEGLATTSASGQEASPNSHGGSQFFFKRSVYTPRSEQPLAQQSPRALEPC